MAEAAILKVADAIGGLMEFWGFKRGMGRMWAILYLTPEARSAQELGEELQMSAGAVSMTLQELTKWGVVKKAWRPGERRDYYEPETDIWKMVSRVFRERELQQIRSSIETFEATLRELGHKGASRRQRFVAERVQLLLQLARLGEALLNAVLEGRRVDPSPIKEFLKAD